MIRTSALLLIAMAPCLLAEAPVSISGERLVEGDPASLVRVVIYEDLQCPDCAAFRRMMDEQILPAYAKTVAFEHHDFPLPRHVWTRQAAIVARYFQKVRPKLGLEYRRHVMQNIAQTTPENFENRVTAFAKDNGVDSAKALAALDDPQLAALVVKDYQHGVLRGVARTPTVYINGVPYIERFTFEQISAGIDTALEELKGLR